jgi:hypothetical protein
MDDIQYLDQSKDSPLRGDYDQPKDPSAINQGSLAWAILYLSSRT